MPSFASRLVDVFQSTFSPEVPLIGSTNPTKPEKRTVLNKLIGDRVSYDRFSPEAQKQVASEYLANIGLGKNVTFSADAFNNYDNARAKDFLGLKEAKTPSGDLIHKKLSETSNDPAVRQAISDVQQEINEALQATNKFNTAKKNYNESIGVFQELVKTIPTKHKAQDLFGAMQEIVDKGIKAIKKQQTAEINELTAKFQNPDFKQKIQTALNINENQVELIKDSMKADLEAMHQKQLEEFKKSTQNSMNTLHKAAEQQLKEFLFLADLHKNDPKMRAMIQELADKHRETLGENVNGEINFSADKATISCVSLDQLKFIQRLGGNKITPVKDASGATTYKLEMGMRLFSPRYYFNNHDRKDLEMLAQAVRASGADTITMTLTFENKKIAQERARDAYEACIKAGFPPEKIKLNVNGTLMTYKAMEKNGQKYESIQEKLFNENPNKFNALQKRSGEIQAELQQILTDSAPKATKPTGTGLDSIRREITQLRTEAETRRQQQQQQQQQPNPNPAP